MLNEDSYSPAPARVLFSRETGWHPDAPAELRARYAHPIPYVETVRKREFGPTFSKPRERSPVKQAKIRAERQPIARLVKPKPAKKERFANSPLRHVTVKAILELQEQGWNARDIAAKLGCTHYTVYDRLREYRRKSPEAARVDAELRVCACGRPKWATKPHCKACSQREYNRAYFEARRRAAGVPERATSTKSPISAVRDATFRL